MARILPAAEGRKWIASTLKLLPALPESVPGPFDDADEVMLGYPADSTGQYATIWHAMTSEGSHLVEIDLEVVKNATVSLRELRFHIDEPES
jgi:hypothetical protein